MFDLTSLHWTWIYVASEWSVRLAMLFIVPRKRSPDAAKGWLMLIFILPWPGLALYLVVGRPYLPKRRLKLKERFLQRISEATQHLRQSSRINLPALEPRLMQAVTLAQNSASFPYSAATMRS